MLFISFRQASLHLESIVQCSDVQQFITASPVSKSKHVKAGRGSMLELELMMLAEGGLGEINTAFSLQKSDCF